MQYRRGQHLPAGWASWCAARPLPHKLDVWALHDVTGGTGTVFGRRHLDSHAATALKQSVG